MDKSLNRPTTSAERLAVLHATAVELTAELDRPRLYQAVVEGAARLVGAGLAVALSWDAARRELVVEASTGAELVSAAEMAVYGGPAFASRTTIHLDDLDEHPRAASLARRLGVGAAAALPIPSPGDGAPLGALCVALERGQPPLTIDDLRALEIFAALAGTALTHAEGVAASARRMARVEQLTVALRGLAEARERELILERGLDCARDVFGADRAAIFLVNGREELASCASRGLSRVYLELAAQRYRQSVGALLPLARAPVYVADLQTDPRTRVMHEMAAREGLRTVLFVPMLRAGRLQGALALYHDLVWPYDAEDLAHARALADELAVALAGAAQSDAAARELGRVRALLRMAHVLVEDGGHRRALQALIDEGTASAAWLFAPGTLLLADPGAPETFAVAALRVARAAVAGGRLATRATPWGAVAAAPLRRGGQVIGSVAVAQRRRPRHEPIVSGASLHMIVLDEIDVAEPQALVAGAAHHLGAALGGGSSRPPIGREPHVRAGGGKP